MIEEITRARFPHLTALLKALSTPPAPLDWRQLYRNQLRALSLPASEVTLRDFVFTITIEAADGVTPPVQWTGGIDAATYASDDAIRLWTAESAPSWAFDGDPDDEDDEGKWIRALPKLTLSVIVSRMGASGPQSVHLCRHVQFENSTYDFDNYNYDFDKYNKSFCIASRVLGDKDEELPRRKGVNDIWNLTNPQTHNPLNSQFAGDNNEATMWICPWIQYCKCDGRIEAQSLFRIRGEDDFNYVNAAGLLTYLVDVVPWD